MPISSGTSAQAAEDPQVVVKSSNSSLLIRWILKNREYKAGVADIWALGITIVIGGQYFSYNAGYVAGLGSYAIAVFLIGTAYMSLICCTSEVTSALPFAGGAYGLARCTLGYYPGFLVGCCEALQYVIYVAVSVLAIGQLVTQLSGLSSSLEPVWWLLFYLSALCIHISGGKLFWRFNYIIAWLSILLLLVYVTGSWKFVSIQNGSVNGQSSYSGYFSGGGSAFMNVLPLAAWLFVGVESLAFSIEMVDNPRRTLPLGSTSCVLTLFATSIFVLFTAACLPSGIIAVSSAAFPFKEGYMLMFDISADSPLVLLLSFPALYATAFGFIFSYGRLLKALGSSKLIPPVFGSLWRLELSSQTTDDTINDNKQETDLTKAPVAALLAGSLLGYIICLIIFFNPQVSKYMFNICMLSAFQAYMCQCCAGYVFMKTKYQNIDREFTSPVGIAGAVYSFFIYLLATISIVTFQNDDQIALISFVVACALLSLFYYFVSRHTQTFSEDEKKIMFRVHVINYNTSGTKRRQVQQQTNKNSIRRLLFGYFYSESQNSSRSNYNGNEKSSGGVSETSSHGDVHKEEASSIRKTASSYFSKTGSARIASTSNNDAATENVALRPPAEEFDNIKEEEEA